jgi:ubiquinone/menaquinone biosynthesis C-methylase UbiE
MTHADRRAALQAARAEELAALLDDLLVLTGDERALDVGAGTGALAFALAPRVREVVALELDEELAERARADAPPNVTVITGDAEQLPFEDFEFELSGSLRTLHHTRRPERVVSELTRVTRPNGTILIADQIAPVDPLQALELNRFEQARDPSTTRVLPAADLRGLFDANDLRLRRELVVTDSRDIDDYLALAGCEGAERDRARRLAPTGYAAVVGWYVLER